MKNNKRRGFSLAELLIALLVISIVLSAAIPTITKRNARREQIWQWAGSNNAYFGAGSGQSALLGITNMPKIGGSGETGTSTVDLFASATDGDAGVGLGGDGNARISNHGDKLVILKQSLENNENTNLMNSHISFYNLKNRGTENQISYAGRIALDTHNIAFGIGTLLSSGDISNDKINGFQGYNTAIGHYTLSSTQLGQYNTAIGERALNHVTSDSNTGVGFEAGFLAGQTDGPEDSLDNTAIGAKALRQTGYSNSNTAVGAYAMANVLNATHSVAVGAHALESGVENESIAQDANTAVGTNSLQHSIGSGNTSIGANACNRMTNGSNNICIGYNSGYNEIAGAPIPNWANGVYTYEMSNGLFIGSSNEIEDGGHQRAPLIYGKTQREGKDGMREVGFLTDRFRIGNFDGSLPDMAEINIENNKNQNTADYRFYVARESGTENSTHLQIKNPDVSHLNPSNRIDILAKGPDEDRDMALNMEIGQKHLEVKSVQDYFGAGEVQPGISIAANDTGDSLKLSGKSQTILSIDNPGYIAGSKSSSVVGGQGSGYIKLALNSDGHVDCDINVDGNLSITSSGDFLVRSRNISISSSDNGEGQLFLSAQDGSDFANISFQGIPAVGSADYFHRLDDSTVIRRTDIHIPGKNYTFNAGQNFEYNLIETLNNVPEEFWSDAKQFVQDNSGCNCSTNTSDIRLKNIISDAKEGLSEILALQVKKYTFKDDKDKIEHIGVIAQDLQEIFPNSVFEGNDGYLRIKTDEILFSMVNAVKELYASIQDLIVKVADHDKRIEELEKQNKILIKQNKELEKRLERLEKKSKN